ncbi:MAG: ATP12 family protein [Alphaproteobacteria bacterium]
MRQPLKRFYSEVALAPDREAFRLTLDGKQAKTPAGRPVSIAHSRLAEAVAEEWRAQAEKIDLASMPLMRLVLSVTDHVAPRVAPAQADALKYGETDLLCYRAEAPEKLALRQAKAWQPYLDWAAREMNAPLAVAAGVVAIEQDKASLAALGAALAALDPYRLLVTQALTARFGSLVLALAVVAGRATALEAFETSRLDEIFQAEIWGADAEAERRAQVIRREVEDLARFLSLLD